MQARERYAHFTKKRPQTGIFAVHIIYKIGLMKFCAFLSGVSLARAPGDPRCEQTDINVVVLNNHIDQQCGLFCHDYLTETETQSLHTEQKHQRTHNTTRFEPEHCNIFHSRSFYVGFKHAISQFNPIFPAFGVLQWNRFHLILNIWPTLPLETPQPCVPPCPKKAVKGKPPVSQCKPLSISFNEQDN